MDYFGVLVTRLRWLGNVTQSNVMLTSVTDICPISFYTLFYVVLISITMPVIVLGPWLLLLFALNACAHVYGHYYGLKNASPDDEAWDKFKYFGHRIVNFLGRLCHGYEVEGVENIPAKGGGLYVAYHGPTTTDFIFMGNKLYLQGNRNFSSVLHRNAFKIPGLGLVLSLMKCCPGSYEFCVKVLNDGQMILTTPGGTYEDTFGDNRYQLLWRNRLGYARVAIEAKSPIIPVFTVNIRETLRSVNIGSNWKKTLYEKWKFVFVLYYGWFPVKLRTIIGQPIPFDPSLTAEELNRKVMMAMEQLIKDNQRLPGSVAMALLDRFKCQKKSRVA